MSNARRFIGLAALAALSGGCGPAAPAVPHSSPPAEAPQIQPPIPPAEMPQPPSEFPADSLRDSLEFPDTVRAGQTVPLILRVRNPTDGLITAYIGGMPGRWHFDAIITTQSGEEVWKMLNHRAVELPLTGHTFGPGEVLEIRDEWNQRDDSGMPVPPRTYTIRAVLSLQEPSAIGTDPKPLVISP